MATSCQSCDTLGVLPTAPAYPGCPPAPPATGCSAIWGQITGDPGNQLDLPPFLTEYLAAEDRTIRTLRIGTGNASFPGNMFVSNTGLLLNVNGIRSTAVGVDALAASTEGISNTGVGYAAGQNITTGDFNTALGSQSLSALTSANNNTALGYQAGVAITTGTQNTALGSQCGPSGFFPTLNNTIAIGYAVATRKDNQAILGNASITETVLRGNIVLDSKTITDIGTTGAQTINKTCGSVVFAAAATSLVVTNSFAVAPTSGATGSIIVVTMRTNDTTAVLGNVVCSADGSFTINMKTAPTAATRVDFVLFN